MIEMKEVLAYLEIIPEFKPVVQELFKNLSLYKSEWEQLNDFIVNQAIKNKAKIYKGLIAEDIPAEHALALTVNINKEFREAIQSYSKVKGVSK